MLLDSREDAFSAGAFTGIYRTAVYGDPSGTLDFLYQATVASFSANSATQLSVADFQGALADIGYRSDGSALAGGLFVDATQIPSDVTRGPTGDPVAWDYAGPSAVNTLPPGDMSMVLEIKTNAVEYELGSVKFSDGSDTDSEGAFAPFVTQMSSAANPPAAHTGTTLQDSATLASNLSLDGSGSITFSLYGPGDTACGTPIHTETVGDITSNGPWDTTTGYVATTPGTYQWVASFSGALLNGSTICGDDPVLVTRPNEITSASTTCAKFAGATASTLVRADYSVAHAKVKAVTPAKFSYWAGFTSTGGAQSFSVDQFTSETSRPFHFAPGSSVYTSGCSTVAASISQSGGVVTVKFSGAGAGGSYFIGLNFSTSGVVGEAKPAPNSIVRYLFTAPGSTPEVDLVK